MFVNLIITKKHTDTLNDKTSINSIKGITQFIFIGEDLKFLIFEAFF